MSFKKGQKIVLSDGKIVVVEEVKDKLFCYSISRDVRVWIDIKDARPLTKLEKALK